MGIAVSRSGACRLLLVSSCVLYWMLITTIVRLFVFVKLSVSYQKISQKLTLNGNSENDKAVMWITR